MYVCMYVCMYVFVDIKDAFSISEVLSLLIFRNFSALFCILMQNYV